jgi:hypothetical protein
LAGLCDQPGRTLPATAIYNGFDADDFQHFIPRAVRRKRVRLVYVGTLWNLTDVSPLVTAVERLVARNPTLAQRLEISIVGRRTAKQERWLDRLEQTPVRILRQGYVDHATAICEMREADVLCLLLADADGAERVVPAKLFEYLAANRTILAIVPPGEAQGILREQRHCHVCHPAEPDCIVSHLEQVVRVAEQPAARVVAQPHQYSRAHQAAELAEILDTVADQSAGQSPPLARSA